MLPMTFLAQATPPADPTLSLPILLIAIIAGLAAPIIISLTTRRITLQVLAALFCMAGLAVAGLSVSFGLLAFAGIGTGLALWAIGLVIALTAARDLLAERREEEHLWRLINSVDDGLYVPRRLRRKAP